MSRTVDIHPDITLVVTRFEGEIDYDDILQWLDEAPLHEGFSREFDGVVDLRKAVFKQTRMEKARLLATHMIEKNFTVGRWAVLVSKPVGIALAMLYEKTAETKHPIHIVSTTEGAARFLGRSLDEIGIAVSD